MYISDTDNQIIRKIDIVTTVVTTFSGVAPAVVGGVGGFADGASSIARFNSPAGITTDGVSLFVADSLNRAIRKIDIATGVVTTLAGNPANVIALTDGIGAAATFLKPTGITTDGTSLYVVDSSTIRKVGITTGAVTTIAGSISVGFLDATGTAALFNLPTAIATDGTNLYLTDNRRVRKLVIGTGVVTTLAGGGIGQKDGVGTAAGLGTGWLGAWGGEPFSITSDGAKLYVGDHQMIRKIQ